MNLVGQGNGAAVYGTGRLFIQGPTQEDWDFACGSGKSAGEKEMLERRAREDVDPEATLANNEWAFYEEEEEVRLSSSSDWPGTRTDAVRRSKPCLAGSTAKARASSTSRTRSPSGAATSSPALVGVKV